MKVALFIFLSAQSAFGHGDAESTSIGKGKGVEYYDEHEGFVLSKEANKRLEIKTAAVSVGSSCDLKPAQIVYSLGKKQIFVVREGKYFAIPMDCKSVRAGDQLVSSGSNFLRVIQMDLQSGEEEHSDEHGDDHGENHGDHHD